MGKVKEFKTSHVENVVIEKDSEVDMGFVNLIFGDPKKAPGTSKRKIVIKTYAEADAVATTGDFFASATTVCTDDDMTEISFIPPAINEEVPVSADDALEFDCNISAKEKNILQARAVPVGKLNRRRNLFISQAAANMATSGKIVHHNGTIDMGFTDISVLAGADKWDDAAADPVADVNKWYDEMDEKPDGLFMDAKATVLFLKGAIETSNGSDAKAANFTRAMKADIDRKSPSKTVRFVGTVLESGLDVYKVTTKVKQADGTKTPLLEDNTVLFAPIGNRNAAKIIYGGIPKVDDSTNPNPRYVRQNERWYTGVNTNETQAVVGILSSPCPIMRNPKYFKKVKVA